MCCLCRLLFPKVPVYVTPIDEPETPEMPDEYLNIERLKTPENMVNTPAGVIVTWDGIPIPKPAKKLDKT